MASEWLRSRMPSGLRSQGCVGTTTSKYGMKLSTKLGLKPHLYLGRQRVSTTLQPFVPPPPAAPRQTPLPRLQILRRVAPMRSLPPLAALQKWSSSLGWMERMLRWLRECLLMPPSLGCSPRSYQRQGGTQDGDCPFQSSNICQRWP